MPLALTAAEFTCPVTKPPKAPYAPEPTVSGFWYGKPALWTTLPNDGLWGRLPYSQGDGYTNKLLLWNAGSKGVLGPERDIIVATKRLDAIAPPWSSRGGSNTFVDGEPVMLTGVNFPTAGCWEVTAKHAGHTLTFVLSIQP